VSENDVYILKGDPGKIERGIASIFRGNRFVSPGLRLSP
jgi:hypothetical protein